jgi:hypothetical protein
LDNLFLLGRGSGPSFLFSKYQLKGMNRMKFINKYPDKRYVIQPVTTVEVAGRPVTKPGKSIQFSNGELETKDKETIAFLKEHPDFGITLFVDDPKAKADTPEGRDNGGGAGA